MDILAIGEILIDLTITGQNQEGIYQFAANPGGAPANLAVAASRLGARTAFVGKVGDDMFGQILQNTLYQNNVDTAFVKVDPDSPTTLAIVGLDEAGERNFSFYRNDTADTSLHEDDIPLPAIYDCSVLHFGSLSLTSETSKAATYKALDYANHIGKLVSYDPNYRASLWPSEVEAVEEILAVMPYVDLLKLSDEEAVMLMGIDNVEEAAKALSHKYEIGLVIVTLGSEGALAFFDRRIIRSKPVKVEVQDTNGAGDTFLGAFLSRIVQHGEPISLTRSEIKRYLDFSNKAASITTSRSGAIPAMPHLNEVD